MAQNNNQNLFLKNSNGIPILRQQFSVLENSSDTSLTYEASEMFNTLIVRSGLTADRTDTFPEASDILGIMKDYNIDDTLDIIIKNNSAQVVNIGLPASISTGNTVVFENVSAGDTNQYTLIVSSDDGMEIFQKD